MASSGGFFRNQLDPIPDIPNATPWHTKAFIFLNRHKNLRSDLAQFYIKDLTAHEAMAVFYNIPKDDVIGLADHLITTLIERKQTEGLQTRAQLENLSEHQINMVKLFYQFGLTSDVARTLPNSRVVIECINHFIFGSDYTYNDCIKLISGLSIAQLQGLIEGLSWHLVRDLNEHQINAAIKYRQLLDPETLRNKHWFDSETHVIALGVLVNNTPQDTAFMFNELEKTPKSNLKMIAMKYLNHAQTNAIENVKLAQRGLTSNHLLGSYWFNSSYHVFALEHLMIKKKMDAKAALDELYKLSSDQAKLIYRYEGLSRSTIDKLSIFQRTLLANLSTYGFRCFEDAISTTSWLKTTAQLNLLKIIYERLEVHDYALALVKQYSGKFRRLESLSDILANPSISNADLYSRAARAQTEECLEQLSASRTVTTPTPSNPKSDQSTNYWFKL